MLTGVREKTVVKEGGKIELSEIDLPEGTEVEVIVLVEEEMDATELLLSTDANREHLEKALRDLKDPAKRVDIDIDDYEKVSLLPDAFRDFGYWAREDRKFLSGSLNS